MGKLGITQIVIIAVISLLIYFIPTIIAIRRRTVHRAGIIVQNVLLGGTGLGWLVALIWAMRNRTEAEVYGSNAGSFDKSTA